MPISAVRIRVAVLSLAAVASGSAACVAPDSGVEHVSASDQEINRDLTAIDPVPLALDGRERFVDYTGSPRFYAFRASAPAGTRVELHAEARFAGGAVGLWLTDDAFQNLGVSNDGSSRQTLSCIVPASGVFYVVVREANLVPGRLAVWGSGPDPDEGVDGGSCTTGDCPDGGGGPVLPPPPSGSLACVAQQWTRAVPADGEGMMAYRGRAYLFAKDSRSWTVVSRESATTQPIPMPAGVSEMRQVRAEIAPNGRPLVTFSASGAHYATFFDGASFSPPTNLGSTTSAHADASGRLYAVTSQGIVEHSGGAQLFRGAFPADPQYGWNVGADGTVYLLNWKSRPSTIHQGDTAYDLVTTSLPHGTMTWGNETKVTSNEVGPQRMAFSVAPDGSLHMAYGLSYQAYYFRSRDGRSWHFEQFKDITTKASLVDSTGPIFNSDPREVKGSIRLLAAEDFDHASITLTYASGSMGIPSFFYARRCGVPATGAREWPTERLAYSGLAFDYGSMAVDERGLPSFLTPSGVRQNVVSP